MDKSDYKIYIIGAGVSGLIAALGLEEKGYSPIVLESTAGIGGRVKTSYEDKVPLDHGFQVLLTAYPMVRKYLDIDALGPCYFDSGAAIHCKGEVTQIGDPLRNPYLFFPTLVSNAATIKDKMRIFLLQCELKRKSIDEIFDAPEQTTLQYLKDKGFSDVVIRRFFLPFFSGIFLEHELSTSSRMFEFVYKMFGEGRAMIPKKGIAEVPYQLRSQLVRTKIHLNNEVVEVNDGNIVLQNGKRLASHFTIIATDANNLVKNLRKQHIAWKKCDTLYFKVAVSKSRRSLIHLVADGNTLINNVVFVSNQLNLNGSNEVISVTVVKPHAHHIEILKEKVAHELRQLFGFTSLEFIKHFPIVNALPDISNLKNDVPPEETRLTTRIFLAGDTLLNGSLNAAMKSGERAAQGVVNLLEKSPDLAQFTSEYL
ncbi:MAG: FAD-dependent oxidoreductase [Croceivirga sp.]